MTDITIVKHNWEGIAVFSYSGQVLKRKPGALLIEAFFQRDDLSMHDIILRRGDRFLEAYFSNRWYNIFEIYDVNDSKLKCWYCNIATPARFENNEINYEDLALDLLVYPDGSQLVLDRDEFAELDLAPQVDEQANTALQELQELFKSSIDFRIEQYFNLA